MRFSSKTFKRRSLRNKKSSKGMKKTRKLKQKRQAQKQRGGSAGSALYRDIPTGDDVTYSDAPTDGLD